MGNPADAARKTFFGDKKFDYGHNTGGPNNPNADSGNVADCSYLAYVANNQAGFNVAYFSTKQLTVGGVLTEKASKYYETVDARDARPGDMLVFDGHVMLIESGNGISGTALGAQSARTGLASDVEFGGKDTYWGRTVPIQTILRPRPETYVPEKDLVGGPGTGIDSPKVATLVDLLKNPVVEGFRPGIYADGGGVPTVGNGLALVVKGSNGWAPLATDTLKGLFRTAGLDPDMVDKLPSSDLQRSADLLNSGKKADASALFGDGRNPSSDGFSLSPGQADRLAAAYVVREVVPKLVTGLSGSLDPADFNALTDGQFAAIGSRLYQAPNWLTSAQGKEFVRALHAGDDSTAIDLLSRGRGERGELEAQAFSRPPSERPPSLLSTADGDAPGGAQQGGHWEDQTTYDALTGLAIGGERRTWVPGASAGKSPSVATAIDFGRGNGWDAPVAPRQTNPADYSRNVQVKVGPDGTVYRSSEATQDAPNGDYKRGDILVMQTDAQGRVLYQSIRHVENGITTLRETERDPVTGKVTVTWTDTTLIDGLRFTRDHAQQGPWLDARGRSIDEVQALTAQQEADRLLARYPAPHAPTVADGAQDGPNDPASPAPGPAPASSSAPSPAPVAASPATAAPAPSSTLDADPDAIQAITGWRPTPGEAGPALAAGTGGILTDAGLQRPGGLPPAPPRIDSRDPTDPSSAHAVNGSDFDSDQAAKLAANAANNAKLAQAQGDVGLFSSLLNWDQQSDLGHVQTALALYNRLNTGGSGVDLAGVASGLGLLSSGLSLADALKSGDLKAIAGAGASFGSNAIQAYSAFN
ncbi:MAG: hypothetical protein EKK53_11440, partial [Burkholderiales bacterium]